MIQSTMMDYPLTVTQLLQHGRKVHGDSKVITWQGDHSRKVTFAETYTRIEKLASALQRLGIGEGDRVGTFCWNHQEHLEAYFAIPAMGAVLHTLNIRLFPEQLTYVVNHGEDKVIIVDDSLIPLLARVKDELTTVETYVVVGDGDASALGDDANVLRYDDVLDAEEAGFDWPEVDERAAAAMCYTSGTTGNPKGVAYSHRSIWTHTFGAIAGGIHLDESDRVLCIVPQFHAMAWGLPYTGWIIGADILQPEKYLQPEPLYAFMDAEKPTYAAAVPTVWNGLLQYGQSVDLDLSALDKVVVGGSAVPRATVEAFDQKYDVTVYSGWGMTETSPLGALAIPPAGVPASEDIDWRVRTGRVVPGFDLRIVDQDGNELPWDGKAVGEFECRGPWVTGSYYGDDSRPDKFQDGWLRTGDVGYIDPKGFMQIVDRTKDVIKSGGEWISSVDLENEIIGHPDVVEAAVIGVPDEKWDERPLAAVVVKEGADLTPEKLSEYLQDRVAKWWIPERWAFIDEVPKTSVGKYDKKVLRSRNEAGELTVQRTDE